MKNKKLALYLCTLILVSIFACTDKKNEPSFKAIAQNDTAILSNFMDFWQYWYDSVQLYKDYKGYDTAGAKLANTTFIGLLQTGNYIPIKINTSPDSPEYRLSKIGDDTSKQEIKNAIINEMRLFFANSQLEGKTLGKATWTSSNGYKLKTETFKGSYVLVKCWFLKCAKCMEEMPRYDSLFMLYGKKNLIFLALAEDSMDSIQKFKAKSGYEFNIIPNQSAYIRNDLHISVFPTYLLVRPDGKIMKVVNRIDAVEYLIKHIEPNLHEIAPPGSGS